MFDPAAAINFPVSGKLIGKQIGYGWRNHSGEGRARIYCNRFKILLRFGRMPGTRTGSNDHQSGGGGCEPDGENDLPGGIAISEGLWDFRTSQTVSGDGAGEESQYGPEGKGSGPLLPGYFLGCGGSEGRSFLGAFLSDCNAPDGPLYEVQYGDLRGIPKIYRPGGHSCLFHR